MAWGNSRLTIYMRFDYLWVYSALRVLLTVVLLRQLYTLKSFDSKDRIEIVTAISGLWATEPKKVRAVLRKDKQDHEQK